MAGAKNSTQFFQAPIHCTNQWARLQQNLLTLKDWGLRRLPDVMIESSQIPFSQLSITQFSVFLLVKLKWSVFKDKA